MVAPSSPSAALEPVTLRVSTYGVQCVSWHPPRAQWSDGGCTVGRQSGLALGHCLCSHLSFFGSAFWVVPVQVDVVRTAEYFGRVTKNPVLALLLGVLYALYALGVAWARWMDVRDRPQVRPATLASEDPCAQYRYALRIGLPGPHGPGVVGIRLRGSGGDGTAHLLPAGTSACWLREPWPLGELRSVWLWQEGGREQPAQYVTQATILDPQQGGCAHFPCHTWLVPAEDGPSSPRGFWAAPPPRVTFWALLRQGTLRGLREEHTLLVLLRPPAHTPFTRVQRLSCGLCLLLCSALISLMFWEVPPQESPQLLRLGHPQRRLLASRQSLRTAVQALSTARQLPSLAALQESWRPEVDLDRLLQLLVRLVRLDHKGMEDSPSVDAPRILGAQPSSRLDLLHRAYCARYLALKLAHVARLLGELGPGAGALQQQVQDAAEALARRLPAGLPSPRPRWRLPWWALLVGWALLASLSAAATFFILLYGFHYGKESSLRWLVATAVSLGQSILVLQPLKVISCALFCVLILKRADGEDELTFDLEE
ncbi:hypothetical protein lerEdw1_011476 [Lerista edwardsae]|nr:hypothetical protein lerEdw1_011476 [Lerista edwardsae]